jgi:hypothetical protein
MAPTTSPAQTPSNINSISSPQTSMAQLPKLVQVPSNTTPSSHPQNSTTPPSKPANVPVNITPPPPPKRALKRKAATEKDIFMTNKRPKYNTLNKTNFAEEYQQQQQKIRDELPIRPDMLQGIILPPECLAKGINGPFKGKTTEGDPGKMYRYAAQNGDKARVKKGQRVSQKVRDTALATFPKLEKRKKEEEKVKEKERLEKRAVILKEIEDLIEKHGKEIAFEKKVNCEDKADLLEARFIHQCWKNLNYAARFQTGAVEHGDLARYSKEFVSTSELLDTESQCAKKNAA